MCVRAYTKANERIFHDRLSGGGARRFVAKRTRRNTSKKSKMYYAITRNYRRFQTSPSEPHPFTGWD